MNKYLNLYHLTSSFDVILNKYKSDFDKVIEFNHLFNVPQINNNKLYTDNIKIIKDGISLINEEYKELCEGIENNDEIEVKDAICDLIYVIYGLYYRLNIIDNNIIYKYLNIVNSNIFNPSKNIYVLFESSVIKKYNDYIYNFYNFNKYMSNLNNNNNNLNYHHLNNDIDNNIKNKKIELYKTIKLCDLINYEIKNINEIFNFIKKDTMNIIFVKDKESYFQNNFNLSLINILNTLYINGLLVYNIKNDFNIVHQSNMSKLCSNEQEAMDTVNSYKERYSMGESNYESPYYEKIYNTDKWIVKNKSTNKILKNINYKPVEKFDGWME